MFRKSNVILTALLAILTSACQASANPGDPVLMAGGVPHHSGVPDYSGVLPRGHNQVSSGLTFNLNPVGNLQSMLSGTPGQQALGNQVVQGFTDASNLWSGYFSDPITINVNIDYAPLPPGVLGGASSAKLPVSYANVMTGLSGDAPLSADDITAVSHLQSFPMQFMTNDTTATGFPRVRDNDGSANNTDLAVNRANAKALGLLSGNHPATDANIVFSSAFSWDFDQSNGVGGGQFDFVGVAAHEIGHAMGFVSGVDVVDFQAQSQNPLDLDPFAVYSVLDLYRYTADSLNQTAQPTGGLNDWATGQPPAADNPFFSIDGGTTSPAIFSTGVVLGDGRQASHWKDNLGLGLLDPTLAPGELGLISALDVQAMDVIGYTLVPEPTSSPLVVAGIVLALIRFRSRA